ncbi:MAG: HlyD family secretion protein [Syntrophaceae bacterium]|nr:HlyD family secretion protein [Deltaproteobacteria bacterium]
MEEKEQGGAGHSNRSRVFLTVGLIAIIIIAGISFYVRHNRFNVTTDDAYVTGRIYNIAPKVAGTVRSVFVEDNRLIQKGDLLLEIDSRDYDVRVSDATAAVESELSKIDELSVKVDVAEKQLIEIQAKIDASRALVALQEANLKQAGQDLGRARKLYEKGAFAEATLEKAMTAYDVAGAQVDAAREQVSQAYAALETQKLVVRQARTAGLSQKHVVEQKKQALEAASLMRGYTKIFAPADGYVTKKSVEVGNQVQAGQPLMAVVSLADVWIAANYKETQLERVRPGQKVKIRVDTYPGRTFSGTVDSIMAGTGSAFSLFPPENATGNYVKVVQRIPVKIFLEKGADPDHLLRVGMSVKPTIAVRQ